MYKLILIFLLCVLNVNAEDIAIVNGKVITTDDVNYFMRQNGTLSNLSNLSNTEKIAIRERLIEKTLFLEAANKTKIEQSPQFIANLARLKDDLLVDMWLKEQMNFLIVSDGEAKDFYDKNKAKFTEPTRIHPRQILVNNQLQANNIIAALKNLKGDMLKNTFIAIANYYSIDKLKQNGGDMGLVSKEQMSPSFANVAWSIPINNIYKKPIQTNLGYHIVYIEEKLEHKLI
ncbi:MAG: peptidylprolyl isomerase, partial [Nitrososphaeraceae archaeon]